MGTNPTYFTSNNGFTVNLSRPVDCVSWNDCQTFITKLNKMTGKQFRLPTEAEWEFAARGGNRSNGYKYAGSQNINEVAWFFDNCWYISKEYSQVVGTKAANELGLFDMSGNVMEWCQDWFGNYRDNAQTNPQGPSSGSYRVIRGGDWTSESYRCRVSYRDYGDARDSWCNVGLRLAM